MRRWNLLTVALYGLSLAVITAPLVVASFVRIEDLTPDTAKVWRSVRDLYGLWPYWLVVGFLTLLQGLFLLTPLQIARGRRVPRGHVLTTAAVAALLMGLLVAGLLFAVGEAVRLEKFGERHEGAITLLCAAGGWIFWTFIFCGWARSSSPRSALGRIVDALYVGSVAELLVAIPCHVWVRHKDYCCAGAATFVGLAAGLSVLLFSFGPAVLFLFIRRLRRLRAR